MDHITSWLQKLFIILLLLPASLCAQTFHINQYTTNQGLPIDNVYNAAQDGNGFVWFATDFGLAHFDGYKFTKYFKENGLSNTTVTDIVYAGGDSLIFASYPTTIQSIHYDGHVNTLVKSTGFALHKIVKQENQYYFYQRNTTVFGILENGKEKYIALNDFLKTENITLNAIVSLKDRGVAFCTSKGLFIKNKEAINHYLKNENVFYITEKKDKKIIATYKNIIAEADIDFNFKTLPYNLPIDYKTLHMAAQEDGTIWIRGDDKGTFRLQNNKLEEFSQRLGMQSKIVNSFFIDKENNTWFCTDGEGVLLKKNTAFVNYETQDGIVNNKVLQLYKNKNKLFIGTSNGLSVKEGNEITTVPLTKYVFGLNYVYKLFGVNNADAGICINNNIVLTVQNKAVDYFKKVNFGTNDLVIANNRVLFAWEKNDREKWISYDTSIIHLVNNEVVSKQDVHALKIMKAYTMASYDNQNWLGAAGGLFTIDDNGFKKIEKIGNTKVDLVYQLYVDKKNRLWICTDNGLFVYSNNTNKKVFTGNTQSSNFCKGITEDNDGKLWCATWEGVYVIGDNNTINYSSAEGLVSKICNTILYDSATNNIYIGTDNGLSEVKISNLKHDETNNNVYIGCNISDTLIVNDKDKLNSDQNNLNFYFSTPFYQENNKLQYEYKLDNGNWNTMLTPSLYLSDLSSGKHVLYARAKKNGVLFTAKETVFTFTIAKAFYSTWWFWLLILLLVQFLFFKIINHYNNIAKEKKLKQQLQQVEYVSLKQQAFTSLMNPHFIFNALNSVQHYVNRQDRLSANKYLSDFATLIRKNFDAAQKSFVSIEEELETIRLYLALEKMRFSDKFEYEITQSSEVEDEEWMLPSMVLQPYLENAIIHGLMPLTTKGLLTIHASVKNQALQICISDNGVGMKKSKLYKTNTKHISRGMQLIKERLEMLSLLGREPIELAIELYRPNEENEGTVVKLSFPLSIYDAFQQQTNKH
jgi:sensor histidine kinase YesM